MADYSAFIRDSFGGIGKTIAGNRQYSADLAENARRDELARSTLAQSQANNNRSYALDLYNATKPAALPTEMQEYLYSQKDPKFMEFLQAKKSPLVDMRTESAFGTKFGGAQGEVAAGLNVAGDKAANEIQLANLLGELGGQVETGKLAPGIANIGAFLQSAGIDPSIVGIDPNMPATIQAISGLTSQMMAGKIGPGGILPANNFSEADKAVIQSTISQPWDQPGAYKIKLEVNKRLDQLAVDKADAFANALNDPANTSKSDEQIYREFEVGWRQYLSRTNIFQGLAEGLAGSASSGPAGPAGPAGPGGDPNAIIPGLTGPDGKPVTPAAIARTLKAHPELTREQLIQQLRAPPQ